MEEKIRIFFIIFKLKIMIELKIKEIILIKNEISILIWERMKSGMIFCHDKMKNSEL